MRSWLIGLRAMRADEELCAGVELFRGGASIARPHSSASAPDSESPVNSSRFARCGPRR